MDYHNTDQCADKLDLKYSKRENYFMNPLFLEHSLDDKASTNSIQDCIYPNSPKDSTDLLLSRRGHQIFQVKYNK